MPKPLLVIRDELRVLVAERDRAAALVVPSDRDRAHESLNFIAGRVLGGGGADALLQLVEQAMAGGRDFV